MRTWVMIFILWTVIQPSLQARKDSPAFRKKYILLREIIFGIIGRTGSERGLRRAAYFDKLQETVPDEVPFPCPLNNTRSPTRPTSVHQLRPGDIDVVAALGDSLTAANGALASNLFEVSTENRGVSWSIGGQGNWRKYLTLPNILKEFNPKLVGYSLGDSLSHQRASQFNVAEAAAMSEDLPFMVRELVRRMKYDKRVNLEKDWKLVTIFIGSNDFCLTFCYLNPIAFQKSAEKHRRDLMFTLDYLRDNVPRTLVNLVLVPNLELLRELTGLPAYCRTFHIVACPCMFGLQRKYSYKLNVAKLKEWQQIEREVANNPRYQSKKDFAVVLQPFTRRIEVPQKLTQKGFLTDRSLLSQDCFHLSQKGDSRAANALWNNMMEPVGRKSEYWNQTFSRFLCPTKEHPYIFTSGNSFRT